MALPRYQNIGVTAGGGVGPIDFPNRGEATRGYDALSSALNTMSEAFFGEARIAATEEGEKYGAENAPTQEQIRLAIEANEPLKPVGDSRTYFGRAADKAYGEVVSTQIAYMARTDIERIKSDASSGAIAPAQIIPSINSVIAGYKSALAQVDPQLARKVEAQLAYEGNNVFLAASRRAAAGVAKETEADIRDTVIDLENGLETVIESGNSVDPKTGTPITVLDKIKIQRDLIEATARRSGKPSYVDRTLRNFDKKAEGALSKYVADWVADPEGNSVARARELETGKITDPAIAGIWGRSTASQRIKIINEAERNVTSRERFKETMTNIQINNLKRESNSIEGEFYTKFFENDIPAQEQAIERLRAIDPVKAVKLRGVMVKAESADDDDVVRDIELSYAKGTLTEERVKQALERDLISSKTARTWINVVRSEDNSDFRAAIEYAKDHPSVKYYSAIDRDVANKNLSRIRAELREKIIANPEKKPMDLVDDIINRNAQKSSDTTFEAATSAASRFATDLKVTARDGSYSVQELQRRLLTDKDRLMRQGMSVQDFERIGRALKELDAVLSAGRKIEGFRK